MSHHPRFESVRRSMIVELTRAQAFEAAAAICDDPILRMGFQAIASAARATARDYAKLIDAMLDEIEAFEWRSVVCRRVAA
jgi:hypothetical protein